jgi:intracellular sulfur oxidation DsrE/DsrF family protein
MLSILTIALSAMCMAYAGQPGQDQAGAAKQTDATRKVVFHIDADQPERLLMALENTRNLFKEIPPDKCSVHVVTNGKAVILFRKDRAASYAAEMEALHLRGVHFKACRNAMAKNKVEKSDLLEICEVVPAGILELIDLQKQRFAYIKP